MDRLDLPVGATGADHEVVGVADDLRADRAARCPAPCGRRRARRSRCDLLGGHVWCGASIQAVFARCSRPRRRERGTGSARPARTRRRTMRRGDADPRHPEELGPPAALELCKRGLDRCPRRSRAASRPRASPAKARARARASRATPPRRRRRRSGTARCLARSNAAPQGYRPCMTVRRRRISSPIPRSARRPSTASRHSSSRCSAPGSSSTGLCGGMRAGISITRSQTPAEGTPPERRRGDQDVAG